MIARTIPAALALMLTAIAGTTTLAQEPEAVPAGSQPGSFVAPDFPVPTMVEGPDFKLIPLGPELADIDYQAYMSSIAHLQQTFTRSTGWPRAGITADEAMADMLNEQGRFQRRESFAYAVLTPDGTRERGCIYVYPSKIPGYDAEIRMWVTKAEFDAGFDARLYAWTKDWITTEWGFGNAAYPGRAIAWDKWDELVAATAGD